MCCPYVLEEAGDDKIVKEDMYKCKRLRHRSVGAEDVGKL
jgi:hypothetical protein